MTGSRSWSHWLTASGFTVVAVAGAAWLELLIAHSSVAQLSLMPSALAIALAVRLGGLRIGLFALLLSALAIDFIVITPGALFDFSAADALVYGAFIAAWLVFCVVADGLHRQLNIENERRTTAERVAWQSDRIAELTGALSHARTQAAAIEAALQEPLHALGAEGGVLFLISSDGTTADVARAVGYPALAAVRSIPLGTSRTPLSDAAGRGGTVFVKGPGSAEYSDADIFPGPPGCWPPSRFRC